MIKLCTEGVLMRKTKNSKPFVVRTCMCGKGIAVTTEGECGECDAKSSCSGK